MESVPSLRFGSARLPKAPRIVILGLDPRTHAGTLIMGRGGQESGPPRAAPAFRHGSQGLRLRCASAPPWDDEERRTFPLLMEKDVHLGTRVPEVEKTAIFDSA